MAEVLTGINGDVIKWAREFYNMTVDEAASTIGVSVEKYSNWEKGTDYPTYSKLKKISEVFRKPSIIFFFPEPPVMPSIKGDLRTLSSEVVGSLSKNIISQFEKGKSYQYWLSELYGNRESIISRRMTFPNDLERLSAFFRNEIGFSIAEQKKIKDAKTVFEIFRQKFYKMGIYVFKDAFKDDNVSGLCLIDENFPVIIINNSMSFTRQNFTLFHELYHLISNTSGAEIIKDDYYNFLDNSQKQSEKKCDMFANTFLIPENDFKREIENNSLDEKSINDLAILYSVSKEAIMYKLLSLNKINHNEYDMLKESFYGDVIRNGGHKTNGKGNYYLKKLSYLGPQYTTDVFNCYYSGRIDNVHASEMLGSKIDHLPKLERTFFRGVER